MPQMRRSEKILPNDTTLRLLETAQVGTLALTGEEGPYPLPINFAFRAGEIFFHCATEGYKLRCIEKDNRAGFCVINTPQILVDQYTFKYQSVIVSGYIEFVTDDAAKRDALMLLAHKYCGENDVRHGQVIEADWSQTCVFKLVCKHISGKGVPM